MSKVSIIGAGQVGSTCANLLVQKDIADVVLIDIVEGLAQGKALDIMQSAPVLGFSHRIVGTDQFEETAGSDIVVITAGSARKPGMTRADLLKVNAKVVLSVVQAISKYASSSIVLVVTNPVDVMAYFAYKKSGFDHKQVIGVSGVLDSARFAFFLAERLGVPIAGIDALVIGAHDDSMIPLVDHSTVDGMAVSSLLPPEALQQLIERTKKGGAEIVSYLRTGSAYYAPGAAAAFTAQMVLAGEQEVIPVSTLIEGQYGQKDLYLGLPCRIGRRGIVERIELELTPREQEGFAQSAQGVKESIAVLGV
jgi:malate dehydrogenase